MGYKYDWQKAFKEAFEGRRRSLDEHIQQVHQNFLFPFVRTKTRSDGDSMEICSSIIAKFWEKFYVRREPLPDNVNAYLNTMARNAAFHFFNMRTREQKTLSFIEEDKLKRIVDKDNAKENPMDDPASQEGLYQALEAALGKLEERCRELLRLNILEGRKIKEIARIMNFPTPNAATQKKVGCFKALRKFAYLEIHHQKQ